MVSDFVLGSYVLSSKPKTKSDPGRRVGKCTVALDDERNDVGILQESGKILFNRDRLMPWLRGLESLELTELKCPKIGLPATPELYQVKILNA